MDEKLKKILSDAWSMPMSDVHTSLTQDDVELWDSQSHLELIMHIETSYGIELNMSDAVSMRSVSDIVQVIRKYTA